MRTKKNDFVQTFLPFHCAEEKQAKILGKQNFILTLNIIPLHKSSTFFRNDEKILWNQELSWHNQPHIITSLSRDGNRSEHYVRQDSGLPQIFKLIVSTSEKRINNIKVVEWRQVK